MSEIKTYCLGRFLIDVPKESEIDGQGYEFMYGINSKKINRNEKDFAGQMAKRETALKAINPDNERAFKETYSIEKNSRILITLENNFGHSNYGFEAYKLNNEHLFSLKQNHFEEQILRNKVLPRLKKDLLPNLHTRQPDEIPTEPGFCIEDGFIAHDGSDRVFEEARLDFNLKNWPDIWLTVYSRTVTAEGQKTLLQRIDANPLPAIFASIANQLKIVRKGKHPVKNFPGEDSLATLPTQEGARVHSFTWEAQGIPHDPFNPTLHLEFSTGHVPGDNSALTRPSLTDDQAIQLFDSIVNSIRLRPTGPAKVSVTESPPLLSLGSAKVTGEICPQSGWWQCEDGLDYSYIRIEGGRQQFFHAGQIMPQAVLLGMPTFWQRFVEGKKSFRQSATTVWKLNAYDDATMKLLAAAQTAPDKANEV